jgi:hypothetical protein
MVAACSARKAVVDVVVVIVVVVVRVVLELYSCSYNTGYVRERGGCANAQYIVLVLCFKIGGFGFLAGNTGCRLRVLSPPTVTALFIVLFRT